MAYLRWIPISFSNLGLQYGAGGRVATSYQIADEANWTRGAHALKLGFNFLHNYSNYTLAGGRGIFSFTGSQLGNSLTSDSALASLVDLVAGLPTPGSGLTQITRVGSPRANIDQNIISGFAMDTYKLTQRLTLVAGLRYDFFTTVNESRGRFSVFDPNQGLIQTSHLYNAPKGDFGPRVSLAWAPTTGFIPGRQTVFRAGFGIYYDTIPLNNFEEGLAQNPVGPTAGFTIVPSAPIPFDVGVPDLRHRRASTSIQRREYSTQSENAEFAGVECQYSTGVEPEVCFPAGLCWKSQRSPAPAFGYQPTASGSRVRAE